MKKNIENKPLTLKVAEASSKDVSRGIVRLDPAYFRKIGVEVGDVVTLKGKRETVAKVMPAYMDDRGKDLIRLDGITRENAGIGIDEKITITKSEFNPAHKIVVAPLTSMRSYDARYIGSLLEGLPLLEGDTVRARLIGTRTQDFKVVSTMPSGVVIIQSDTSIKIQEKKGDHRCFTRKCLQIRSNKPMSNLGYTDKIYILGQGHSPCVDIQYFKAAVFVRYADLDLTIKTSRSSQGWIKDIWDIGGTYNDELTS